MTGSPGRYGVKLMDETVVRQARRSHYPKGQ
jgi:hypothetical protein